MPLPDMNAGRRSADQQPRSTCSSCSPDIGVRFAVFPEPNLTRVSGAGLSAEIGVAFSAPGRVVIRDARHAGGGPPHGTRHQAAGKSSTDGGCVGSGSSPRGNRSMLPADSAGMIAEGSHG